MKKQLNKMRRPRLLIIGCGDVGMRLLPLVRQRFRVIAVTSNPQRCAELRAAGAMPVVADLDCRHTLARLSGLADCVVHLAPPPADGQTDRRTRHLAAILPDNGRLVYVSTTGVYGDCAGAQFDETRPVAPRNVRAVRRVDAERTLRGWAKRRHGRLSILRVPGIYAADRLPLERLQRGTPALLPQEDVYTNHIHADDLARLILRAIWYARPLRAYHAVDDSDCKMGEYFDEVAAAFGMTPPPRLSRTELAQQVTPVMLSFMSESRRLLNHRIVNELGFRFQYPDVAAGLAAAVAAKHQKDPVSDT